ncbi:hypothetical protein [Flavobacterium palustre]
MESCSLSFSNKIGIYLYKSSNSQILNNLLIILFLQFV